MLQQASTSILLAHKCQRLPLRSNASTMHHQHRCRIHFSTYPRTVQHRLKHYGHPHLLQTALLAMQAARATVPTWTESKVVPLTQDGAGKRNAKSSRLVDRFVPTASSPDPVFHHAVHLAQRLVWIHPACPECPMEATQLMPTQLGLRRVLLLLTLCKRPPILSAARVLLTVQRQPQPLRLRARLQTPLPRPSCRTK